MKKLILILPAVLFFCFAGCKEEKKIEPQFIKNEAQLKELVTLAVDGDEGANDSLSMITDPSKPILKPYNQIITGTIRTLSGKKYYYVLLENPGPVFNSAAVYDSALNIYYLDKNLNGKLSIENLKAEGLEFLLLKESFLSKDVIEINKIKLIRLDSNEVYPVLDLYAGVKTPKLEMRQVIEELNSERITTSITTFNRQKEPEKGDVFLYNPSEKQYISNNNTFKQMALEVINSFKKEPELLQITDSASALVSAGINLYSDSLTAPPLSTGKEGFSLTFKEEWKKVSDLVISDYLITSMKGTKFINRQLGAEISVIQIPQKDSSEMYTRFPLPQTMKGKYKVRFSQKIESGKGYLQLFEYSCGKNKYLMIFKASKYSYYRNKETYEEIINSFTMDC